MLNPARRLVPLARSLPRQSVSPFSSLSSPLRYLQDGSAKYSSGREGREGGAPQRERYRDAERSERGDRGMGRDAGRGMGNYQNSDRRESSAPRRDTQHRQNGQPFTDSYHLSDRIKLLATRKEFDSAIDLVKTSSAANVVVWNLLIHEVLMHRDFKRAYELWMDMKRRGMTPTTRSYSTFFAGYGKIKELEGGALARVQTIYAQWLMYSERIVTGASGRRSILEEGEDAESISCIPTNAYLTLLGNVKNYALLMETFNAMPSTGPTAPNSLTYSIVLSALRASDEPEHFQSAMKLWQRMLSEGFEIDTKTISLIISICREAKRPDDQKVGLEIAKEFYGFVNPEDEASLVFATVKPKAPLDTTALSNVLSLALAMQQYNLVVRWFDQVRDHPKRFGKMVLENWHCDLVMVALAVKRDASGAEDLLHWMLRSSSSSLQPSISTYTNAIQVCWRTADLPRAYKMLSLMTGRPIPATDSLTSPLSTYTTFMPDERIVSTLLQTSLATKNRGDIARTLEIVESLDFGPSFFLDTAVTSPSTPTPHPSAAKPDVPVSPSHPVKNANSFKQFWTYKLGEILERALERVLQAPEGILEAPRRRALAIWRGNVVTWLEAQQEKPPAAADGEESMKGRREVLQMKEARRAVVHRGKQEVNDSSRAKEARTEKADAWVSDEGRTRSPAMMERDRAATSNSQAGGSRRQYGGEDSTGTSFQDRERPRNYREEYRTQSRYGDSSRPSPAPQSRQFGRRDEFASRAPSSSTPPPTERAESAIVEQEKWNAAPVVDWPTRQAPYKSENQSPPRVHAREDRPSSFSNRDERAGSFDRDGPRRSYGEREERPVRFSAERERRPEYSNNRYGSERQTHRDPSAPSGPYGGGDGGRRSSSGGRDRFNDRSSGAQPWSGRGSTRGR